MTTPKKNPTTKERIGRILRVNTQSLTHVIMTPLKPTTVKPSKPTVAAPPSHDLFKRPVYVPGDGETMHAKRPGAEDHLKFKTRGNPT
ncbi:hypothetical protein UFOVP56_63 [uncultured Caudovirales phage]|uniref:Uncharacterized protein n=1 Tax=uncultured Caudovirales phage TaxID=2100421 RepID=A0A6J5T8R9_9CAUD|nr:hypothetical protein UFOVP56_63 [uncultured Caudovirales phage]